MIRLCLALSICAAAILVGRPASAEDANQAVKLSDNVTLQAPGTWKKEEPTSSFRKAQFSIPAAKGDDAPAELVVFGFGGAAGGVDANVQRWIDQFDPKGRKAEVVTGEAKAGKYVFADLSGTYNMPVGPPIQRKTKAVPGSRVLAVILAVDGEEVYFLKMSGPDKTVAAQADALRASFGADKSKEKKYEMPAD